MFRKKWMPMLALVTLFLTACSTAVGSIQLSGLQALRDGADGGPTAAFADEVEAAAPLLDVVEVRQNEGGDLIVNALIGSPQTKDLNASEAAVVRLDTLRISLEAVWKAGLAHFPDSENYILILLSPRTVSTLDRGPAPTAWMELGVLSTAAGAADYLAGDRNLAAFQIYADTEDVLVAPLNEAYTGTPNHPLRSLEVQS